MRKIVTLNPSNEGTLFGLLFGLAILAFFLLVGVNGYKQHSCSLYCNQQNQVCADTTIGSDHYICMEPNARNVRIMEDESK